MGSTQSGKTYFVQQILKHNRIVYEEQKSSPLFWYYNQWQKCFEDSKKFLGKGIRFERGVPELSKNMNEINPRYKNISILNDLMAEATDSPVVSRLFTQGRLTPGFLKGNIVRISSKMPSTWLSFEVLATKKQIRIINERMFDNNRVHIMNACYKETEIRLNTC